MSLNYMRTLQPVALIDPRLDFDLDETSTVGSDDNPQGMGDKYLVYRGPKNIEYFEVPPTSGDGGNNAASTDFTIFMPSRETILDRCIFLKANIEVYLEAAAAGPGGNYLAPGRFGLTAFPIHHCINVLTLQIDGVSYTVDLQNSFKHLKYYSYTEDELKTYSSGAPVLLDNSSIFYTTGTYNVLAPATQKTMNSILPRGSFQANEILQFPGNDGEGGKTAQKAFSRATYTVTEPIYLSPLIVNAIQQSRSTGLTGLANIKIKITWKQPSEAYYYGFNLDIYGLAPATAVSAVAGVSTQTTGALITTQTIEASGGSLGTKTTTAYYGSGVPTATITGIGTKTLTITKPTFLIGMLSLPDTHISPSINSYSFMRYETHLEDSGTNTTGSGSTFTITSRNYNLAQIPHYVILAVNPTVSSNNFSQYMRGVGTIPVNAMPDNYYGIQNVNIKLGTRSGLLATCKPELLYLMNRNNGLAFTSYTDSGMKEDNVGQFVVNATAVVNDTPDPKIVTYGSQFVVSQGCPLLLAFGKDIALDDASMAPGVATNTNFQFTLTCNNKWRQPDKYTLTIIFVYNGIFTIGTTGSSYVVAPLSRDDVLNSESEQVDLDDLESGNVGSALVGGSFFSKLKRMGKKVESFVTNPKVQNFVKDVVRAASVAGVPGAAAVDTALDKLSGNALGGGYVPRGGGYHPRGGTMVAGALGGNILTAADLRRRLQSK